MALTVQTSGDGKVTAPPASPHAFIWTERPEWAAPLTPLQARRVMPQLWEPAAGCSSSRSGSKGSICRLA